MCCLCCCSVKTKLISSASLSDRQKFSLNNTFSIVLLFTDIPGTRNYLYCAFIAVKASMMSNTELDFSWLPYELKLEVVSSDDVI